MMNEMFSLVFVERYSNCIRKGDLIIHKNLAEEVKWIDDLKANRIFKVFTKSGKEFLLRYEDKVMMNFLHTSKINPETNELIIE